MANNDTTPIKVTRAFIDNFIDQIKAFTVAKESGKSLVSDELISKLGNLKLTDNTLNFNADASDGQYFTVANDATDKNENAATLVTKLNAMYTTLLGKLGDVDLSDVLTGSLTETNNNGVKSFTGNSNKALNASALATLVTAIYAAIGNKVDKVSGKGLSANDFTNADKTKLEDSSLLPAVQGVAAGSLVNDIIAYIGDKDYISDGLVAFMSQAIGKIDGNSDAAYKLDNVSKRENPATSGNLNSALNVMAKMMLSVVVQLREELAGKVDTDGSKVLSDNNFTAAYKNKLDNAATAAEVSTAINSAISSAYKAGGSKTAAELTSALLTAGNEGLVYNLSDTLSITDANKSLFTENAVGGYPAGTNIVVIKSGSGYLFDVLAGFVDLSGYVRESDLDEITATELETMFTAAYSGT